MLKEEAFDEPAGLLAGTDAPAALSPRERSVLQLAARGLMNKEIADRLGLSLKAVETFRSRLMKKTGARNLAYLVRFACDTGQVRPADPESGASPGPRYFASLIAAILAEASVVWIGKKAVAV